MCLLALFFRAVDDAPVVVGANREEAYARGGEPPRVLDSRAVAGVDPVAGGTWLGVNRDRVLVAVTNRPKGDVPAEPRSRGLLARELLGHPSAAKAADAGLRELGSGRYAGCNLLCVDPDSAYVIHAGDWLRARPLPPGLHVLTARDVNDAADKRLAYAHEWLLAQAPRDGRSAVAALEALCAQPGNGSPPVSLHGTDGGTVSSTVVQLRAHLARSTYHHAQGPPDRVPYADYSHLLRELAAAPRPEE